MKETRYNLDLSQEARNVFDALEGGFARGGELYRRSGVKTEDEFVGAVRELTEKDLVKVEGEIEPNVVMLTIISARPSAYEFVKQAKRAW